MILATGLRQYAKMHQSVLARIADWDLLSKSKTVRDFDQYCTRHTGKYEVVICIAACDFLTAFTLTKAFPLSFNMLAKVGTWHTTLTILFP
jgi:hypothetical protein